MPSSLFASARVDSKQKIPSNSSFLFTYRTVWWQISPKIYLNYYLKYKTLKESIIFFFATSSPTQSRGLSEAWGNREAAHPVALEPLSMSPTSEQRNWIENKFCQFFALHVNILSNYIYVSRAIPRKCFFFVHMRSSWNARISKSPHVQVTMKTHLTEFLFLKFYSFLARDVLNENLMARWDCISYKLQIAFVRKEICSVLRCSQRERERERDTYIYSMSDDNTRYFCQFCPVPFTLKLLAENLEDSLHRLFYLTDIQSVLRPLAAVIVGCNWALC